MFRTPLFDALFSDVPAVVFDVVPAASRALSRQREDFRRVFSRRTVRHPYLGKALPGRARSVRHGKQHIGYGLPVAVKLGVPLFFLFTCFGITIIEFHDLLLFNTSGPSVIYGASAMVMPASAETPVTLYLGRPAEV